MLKMGSGFQFPDEWNLPTFERWKDFISFSNASACISLSVWMPHPPFGRV